MDYYKIAVNGRIETLNKVSKQIIDNYTTKVISKPKSGMVMIKHIDPIDNTPFYMGEAYVTQCEVEVNGHIGYGCILGEEPERAIYAAILDACFINCLPIPGEIQELLVEELKFIDKSYEHDFNIVLNTKVNFNIKKG